MVNQNYYITSQWNLKDGSIIDYEKSSMYFKERIPYFILYLKPHIKVCKECGSKNIRLIKTKKKLVKTTLLNGSFGLIEFHYRIYKCDVCGKYTNETLDGLESEKGISRSLDMAILNLLKDSSFTYKMISDYYHVSDTYIENVFDRYVDIKRGKLPYTLSVDEIYSRKLTKTKYCFIMYDPMDNKIIDVLDSRRLNYLSEYFIHIEKKERDMVKYYTSDLNETYRTIHDRFFSNSIHAVDSFHVIKNLSDLFNKIRIRVMKEYEYEYNYNNSSYWLFKKFNKLLFKDMSEIEDKEYNFKKFNMILDKYSLVEEMIKVDEDLKEAYYLMKEYKNFNEYYSYDEASDKLEELIDNFMNSHTEEMKSFGYLLVHWRKEIINSFLRIGSWRLSNGKMENANRGIKLMFSNAYGYSNFPRTRNRIMYTYNGSEPLLNKEKEFSNKRILKPRGKYKITH